MIYSRNMNNVYEKMLTAVIDGDIEKLRTFLSTGLDVNIKLGRNLDTFLHLATKVNIVKELLSWGADVNLRNLSGETPILRAIVDGKGLLVVEALISANADIHRRYFGSTLLHYASDGEVTKVLLLHGLNVDVRNIQNRTPLHYAVVSPEALERVRVLLQHGAEVNATDSDGETALYSGVAFIIMKLDDAKVSGMHYNYSYDFDVIKELLEYGADINLQYIEGDVYSSPLGIAVNSEHLPLIKLLIKFTLITCFNKDYKKIINLDPYIEEDNYSAMLCYQNECVSELDSMKVHIVSSNYSLYDIAIKMGRQIKPLYCNSQILEQDITRYHKYYDVILPRIKLSIEKANLLGKLRGCQICVTSRKQNEEIHLIPDCICQIGEYLSNYDLSNFIAAFYNSN